MMTHGTSGRRRPIRSQPTLIPAEAYRRFLQGGTFYPENLEAFARQVGIDPGIVAGRLQHEKQLKPQWGNDLRQRYEWTKPE